MILQVTRTIVEREERMEAWCKARAEADAAVAAAGGEVEEFGVGQKWEEEFWERFHGS